MRERFWGQDILSEGPGTLDITLVTAFRDAHWQRGLDDSVSHFNATIRFARTSTTVNEELTEL